MGTLKLVACFEQLTDRSALGSHKLVDRPRCDRWLAQLRYPRSLIPVAACAKRFRERGALGNETLERQPVEVVRLCHRGETNDY